MPETPNIVFIMADDMGFGDLGCFGNPHIELPHLDAMAEQGVPLTQHYSGSCMCAPARASFLTGKYPHRTGAVDVVEVRGLDRIAPGEATIAQLLSRVGYATACIGKWHNGAIDPEYHPMARGFDEFVGFRAGLVTSYWDWTIERNERFTSGDGRYLTDVFTEAAVDFIHRHAGDPFFLYLPYNAPHTPWEAPEADIEHFRDIGKFSEDVCTIYAMNRRMDAGIGRILETLNHHGVADNTVIVFTSDNGPLLENRGVGRYNCGLNGEKGDVLEGGIRVPCIVRWPAGLDCNEEVTTMTHFADWLPTLLAIAGTQAFGDPDIDGRDILPVLRGNNGGGQRKQFWQWNRYTPVPHCNAAMRDGPWKLYQPPIPQAMKKPRIDSERTRYLVNNPQKVDNIWTEPPIQRKLAEPEKVRLFDLNVDPTETDNVAEQYPRRTGRMRDELQTWFNRMQAEFRRVTDR